MQQQRQQSQCSYRIGQKLPTRAKSLRFSLDSALSACNNHCTFELTSALIVCTASRWTLSLKLRLLLLLSLQASD
jgi:hypothetical protein